MGRHEFLSTLSLRRATLQRNHRKHLTLISIHALLAESDSLSGRVIPNQHISIHALLAESDRKNQISQNSEESFLSTLSLRRATNRRSDRLLPTSISIHALLAESDPSVMQEIAQQRISIHALLAESDSASYNEYLAESISIHALLAESDEEQLWQNINTYISIHALLAESDSKSAQNSGALLRIWNKFYGDCIFMLTGKAVFYPFCPCFFHIFWCEGSGNFMIAFPSH